MSELTQLKKVSTTHTAPKKKIDKESQHSSPLTASDHHHSGTAQAELLNETAEGIFDATSSSVLGSALSRVSSPGSWSPGGTFAGKSFADVPTRAPGQGGVQTKLTVGAAHDPYEEEADQIAEQVMRMTAPTFAAPAGVGAPDDAEAGGRPPEAHQEAVEQTTVITRQGADQGRGKLLEGEHRGNRVAGVADHRFAGHDP